MAPDGLVVLNRSNASASAAQVERLAAGQQHRRLRERRQGLVGRQHEGVGAERQRVLRQVRVEAEVRAPGAVHEQRHAGRPAPLGDGGHVGQHAHVRTAPSGTPRWRRDARPARRRCARAASRPAGRCADRAPAARTPGSGRPARRPRTATCGWCATRSRSHRDAPRRAPWPGWPGWSRSRRSGTSRRPRPGRPGLRPLPACPCSRAGRRWRWSAAGRAPGTHLRRGSCGRGRVW